MPLQMNCVILILCSSIIHHLNKYLLIHTLCKVNENGKNTYTTEKTNVMCN